MKEEIFEASLTPEMIEADRKNIVLLAMQGASPGASRLKANLFDLSRVDRLMEDAIDVHIHPGPDPYMPRVGDALELAIEAWEAGMAAVVFKCHFFPSASYVPIVQRVIHQMAKEKNKKTMDVFGGVVLNYPVGGLNPEAVIAAARVGGKVVWTPNQDASHRRRRMGNTGGINVLDENDKVVPEMLEILKLVAEGDLILGLTGGQSTKERFILIDKAKEMGIKRMEVIHPNQPNSKMTVPQMKIAAEKGAYIGLYCYDFGYPEFSWDEFMEAYHLIGSDRIITATDQGSFCGFHPVVAMRRFITNMLVRGIPDEDVKKMVKTNPRNILY